MVSSLRNILFLFQFTAWVDAIIFVFSLENENSFRQDQRFQLSFIHLPSVSSFLYGPRYSFSVSISLLDTSFPPSHETPIFHLADLFCLYFCSFCKYFFPFKFKYPFSYPIFLNFTLKSHFSLFFCCPFIYYPRLTIPGDGESLFSHFSLFY